MNSVQAQINTDAVSAIFAERQRDIEARRVMVDGLNGRPRIDRILNAIIRWSIVTIVVGLAVLTAIIGGTI